MNRITMALNAALLASSIVGTGALAADPAKADKAQGREQAGAKSDAKRTGAAAGGAAAGATGAAAASRSGNTTTAGGGRDWSQIDKNKDNLIGPDEMEEWLKANKPAS